MSTDGQKNSYLDQVVANQQRLEGDLKVKRMAAIPAAAAPARAAVARHDSGRFVTVPEAPATSNAVEVRVTGWWRWKTVIVPPNAYVVHTRRGHADPLHLGLGVSFKFNPFTDSFLAVPGAMQTILINAHCICKELQGLLVQGYVQWIIHDFGTAYRKLDFGDAEDPMRVVNLQLREQAEAAIKDKVATMNIDAVLSDKQPIIEELTARLRQVAEGAGSDKGLGLRIVTVQIKEAVVSSSRLWENLQKPFRAERARIARLAELESEEVVSAREAVTQKVRETTEMETERELAVVRAKNEAEAYDRSQSETTRRMQKEQSDAVTIATAQHQAAMQKLELAKAQVAAETEAAIERLAGQQHLAKLTAEGEAAVAHVKADAANKRSLLETNALAARQQVDNDVSPANLQARVIETLPELMEKLPKPSELKAVTIGGNALDSHSVAGAVAQIISVVKALETTAK